MSTKALVDGIPKSTSEVLTESITTNSSGSQSKTGETDHRSSPPPPLPPLPPTSSAAVGTSIHPYLMQQFLNSASSSSSSSSSASNTTNSSSTTNPTTSTATQLLQNYALVASSNGQNSNETGLNIPGTSQFPFWNSSSNHPNMFGQSATSSNPANEASQLVAQMIKESKGNNKSNEKLFCLMCGQTCNDSMEYEQHLLSHFSMMDAANNQKIYQYGMHFLQMQSLLNGQQLQTNQTNNPVMNGQQQSQQTSKATNAAVLMSKKRKLLSAHQTTSQPEVEPSSIKNRMEGSSEQTTSNGSEQANEQSNGRTGSLVAAQSSSSTAAAFPCTSCHKTFATEVDLKAHLIRHLTQHPFVCFSCGKGFKYDHSLNFHIKSYHSGNNNSSSNSTNGNQKNSNGEKSMSKSISNSSLQKCENGEQQQQETNNSPLKLKRKSSTSMVSEEKRSKQQQQQTQNTCPDESLKANSSFMAPTLITDENHNQATARSLNWSNCPDLTYFYGKPPTNLPPDSPIQIRSEKILISILDAVNVATEQSLVFYKCCLCCVAFPSLDQMNGHLQTVHHLINMDFNSLLSTDQQKRQQQAAAAAMTALLSGKTPLMEDSNQLNSSTGTVSSTGNNNNSGNYQCDKCLARFTESVEYEIHSQLHRTLEMASSSSSPLQSSNSQYHQQMQILNSLMIGAGGGHQVTNNKSTNPQMVSHSPNSPSVVDFRKILASASKNTDFGRKFAAHLMMDGSGSKDGTTIGGKLDKQLVISGNSGDNNFPPSAHDSCSSPVVGGPSMIPLMAPMMPSSSNKLSSDNNNNSLLYLSGIVGNESITSPHHHQPHGKSSKLDPLNLTDSGGKNSTNNKSKVINGGILKAGSGSCSSSSSTSSTVSSRHIKEPVDIFEGAGQSLPIQKFPLGDIEETAPGQFKCRFCDKTFDRVFSVHRHERVHTGFKPCVCKTCGRGFSEKRNLRHHIIRFHSDGSGRELLKRKRKPKNSTDQYDTANSGQSGQQSSEAALTMMMQRAGGQTPQQLLMRNGQLANTENSTKLSSSAFMSSLFSSAAGSLLAGALQFPSSQTTSLPLPLPQQTESGSLSNLKISLAELNRINKTRNNKEIEQTNNDLVLNSPSAINLISPNNNNNNSSSSGSSRRRKSKPSKKVVSQDEEEEDEENDKQADEEQQASSPDATKQDTEQNENIESETHIANDEPFQENQVNDKKKNEAIDEEDTEEEAEDGQQQQKCTINEPPQFQNGNKQKEHDEDNDEDTEPEDKEEEEGENDKVDQEEDQDQESNKKAATTKDNDKKGAVGGCSRNSKKAQHKQQQQQGSNVVIAASKNSRRNRRRSSS